MGMASNFIMMRQRGKWLLINWLFEKTMHRSQKGGVLATLLREEGKASTRLPGVARAGDAGRPAHQKGMIGKRIFSLLNFKKNALLEILESQDRAAFNSICKTKYYKAHKKISMIQSGTKWIQYH